MTNFRTIMGQMTVIQVKKTALSPGWSALCHWSNICRKPKSIANLALQKIDCKHIPPLPSSNMQNCRRVFGLYSSGEDWGSKGFTISIFQYILSK